MIEFTKDNPWCPNIQLIMVHNTHNTYFHTNRGETHYATSNDKSKLICIKEKCGVYNFLENKCGFIK